MVWYCYLQPKLQRLRILDFQNELLVLNIYLFAMPKRWMRRVRSWYKISILKSAKTISTLLWLVDLFAFRIRRISCSWPPSLHVSSDPWLGSGASQDSLVWDEFTLGRQRRLKARVNSFPINTSCYERLAHFYGNWTSVKTGFLTDRSDINFYSMAYTELPQPHVPANANTQRIDCTPSTVYIPTSTFPLSQVVKAPFRNPLFTT